MQKTHIPVCLWPMHQGLQDGCSSCCMKETTRQYCTGLLQRPWPRHHPQFEVCLIGDQVTDLMQKLTGRHSLQDNTSSQSTSHSRYVESMWLSGPAMTSGPARLWKGQASISCSSRGRCFPPTDRQIEEPDHAMDPLWL